MGMCHTSVMRCALVLLLCTSLLCALGFAQAPGTLDPAKQNASKQKDEATFNIQTNVVIVPTTVRDRNGQVVDGLQLQDFELYDNNKLQKITADVREEPLSLVVAVQRSSNLTEVLPKIQRIGSLLNQLLAGQEGQVAVIGFDHRIQVMQDFTSEGTKISEAMKKMTPGSAEHAVVDATDTAIRMLKKQPLDRRRVLLLIAEKRDKGSELRLREALTQAQFANVSIYSLDISTIVAALTDKGQPQRPPSIPPEAIYHARRRRNRYAHHHGAELLQRQLDPRLCRHLQSRPRVFLWMTLSTYSRASPAAGNTRSLAKRAWRKRYRRLARNCTASTCSAIRPTIRLKADSTTLRSPSIVRVWKSGRGRDIGLRRGLNSANETQPQVTANATFGTIPVCLLPVFFTIEEWYGGVPANAGSR